MFNVLKLSPCPATAKTRASLTNGFCRASRGAAECTLCLRHGMGEGTPCSADRWMVGRELTAWRGTHTHTHTRTHASQPDGFYDGEKETDCGKVNTRGPIVSFETRQRLKTYITRD